MESGFTFHLEAADPFIDAGSGDPSSLRDSGRSPALDKDPINQQATTAKSQPRTTMRHESLLSV
jgi:hypothetical protein